MKEWLIGITALALLMILSELLLSEGETKKYADGFLRLVFVIAVFSGLIKILPQSIQGSFDIDFFHTDTTTAETIDYVAKKREEEAEKNIVFQLKKMGIREAEVNIHSYRDGEMRKVEYVTVEINKSGITQDEANIIAIEDIKNAVIRYVDVREEFIFVYGWD